MCAPFGENTENSPRTAAGSCPFLTLRRSAKPAFYGINGIGLGFTVRLLILNCLEIRLCLTISSAPALLPQGLREPHRRLRNQIDHVISSTRPTLKTRRYRLWAVRRMHSFLHRLAITQKKPPSKMTDLEWEFNGSVCWWVFGCFTLYPRDLEIYPNTPLLRLVARARQRCLKVQNFCNTPI